jgi:NTP pyrophosphatase (non-canonical NTP hydrolase)
MDTKYEGLGSYSSKFLGSEHYQPLFDNICKGLGIPRHLLEQEMSYTFDEYQNTTHQTSVYPSDESQETESVTYLTLGLVGESGEVAEKIKKALRDDGGVITPERKALLHKELGDILWYHSELCSRLGFNMGEVAKANIDKLLDRKARGVLHGSGDNR